jgi:CRISPR-associated endonuclease/helicase Cas3
MPCSSHSWFELGHIPAATPSNYDKNETETKDELAARHASLDRSVDVAERATRHSKLHLAIRLHDAFPGRSELRELRADELRPLLRALLELEITDENERTRALAVVNSRFERHLYDPLDDNTPESKQNELIVFKTLLEPPNLLELPTPDEDDGEDDLSEGNRFISLDVHTRHVVDHLASSLDTLHLSELDPAVRASAPHHDIGKLDARFQAMLAGVTPYEAIMLPKPLAKGDGVRRTRAERDAITQRAQYPRGFRHEMLSIEVIEHLKVETDLAHRDLFLHLIVAHHGYARPFAPVCFDDATDDDLRSLRINGHDIAGGERKSWTPSHRLDSGVAERFWKLTREHGWWGLAWLESTLRLADQQASAAEQEGKINE